MRTLLVIAGLLGSTAAVQAQPGQTDPVGYYAPMVQLQLTEEQADLLAQGEISIGRYVTGGVLSYAVGFGVGHMVQGRWNDQGWIFTVGEAAALTAIVYGLAQSAGRHEYDESSYDHEHSNRRGRSYILGGVAALVGFRVWEVVDAWVAPPLHNRKVRRLKQQLGLAPPVYGFYLAPPQTPDGSGGVAGLSLRF